MYDFLYNMIDNKYNTVSFNRKRANRTDNQKPNRFWTELAEPGEENEPAEAEPDGTRTGWNQNRPELEPERPKMSRNTQKNVFCSI